MRSLPAFTRFRRCLKRSNTRSVLIFPLEDDNYFAHFATRRDNCFSIAVHGSFVCFAGIALEKAAKISLAFAREREHKLPWICGFVVILLVSEQISFLRFLAVPVVLGVVSCTDTLEWLEKKIQWRPEVLANTSAGTVLVANPTPRFMPLQHQVLSTSSTSSIFFELGMIFSPVVVRMMLPDDLA